MQKQDIKFMRRALELARRGEGRVHPNPMVGAVLARRGRALAAGAHEFFGGPHAEANALKRFKKVPRGSTLFLTLEPCDHFGKTPPCTRLLLSRGVERVVLAMKDPDPRVCGRGIRRLRRAGVSVTTGVLEKEARQLNRHYIYWMKKKIPWVTVKVGQSLDGKIATRTGHSRWITGPAARLRAHALRKSADAILVGVNTVLRDDPLLTVRLPARQAGPPAGQAGASGGKTQPLKVILDASRRTPPSAAVFSKRSPGRVLIYTSRRLPAGRLPAGQAGAGTGRDGQGRAGKAEWVVVPEKKAGLLDWRAILRDLGKRGVTHLLAEGGGEVHGSLFGQRRVNEAFFFTAPRVLGGRQAVSSVGGLGEARIDRSVHFKHWDVEKIGGDLLFHGLL